MKKIYITILSILFASHTWAQCDVQLSPTNPCAGSTVFFSIQNSTGAYTWDFTNDGNTNAYGNNVSYTFPMSNVDISYPVWVYENGILCDSISVFVSGIPDPSIGVLPGSGTMEGDLIRVCSGDPTIELFIYNTSTTYATNQSYLIDWGDGSVENYDNNSFPNTATISHQYSGYGYFYMSITTVGANGCSSTKQYTLYNGSNPSVGLANPGNTVGLCAPASIDFPITNTASNPSGTVYTVYVNGDIVALYNQDNIPNVFSYTFLEPSCGQSTSTGNYENAFDVQIQASNPCGSSQATIEPIELSSPPEPVFVSDQPAMGCEGEPITFTNATQSLGEVLAGTCSSLTPSWSITPGVPGVHWEIISGNVLGAEQIEVVFLIPGTYTITMTVNSPSCGTFSFSESFQIFEDVNVDAVAALSSAAAPANNDCLPTIGVFTNLSTGDSLEYTWQISPSAGWEYIPPFDAHSTDLQINFTAPGSYHVTLSAGGYCGNAGWDTTLVIADVPQAIIPTIPNQCATGLLNFDTSNVTINANYGVLSNIQWSFPGASPSASTDTYPTNIYYDTPGTYYISVSLTNQCGTTTSATQTFTVEPEGAVTVGDNINICETASPFTLYGSPLGGTWSGNGVTPNGLFTPSIDNVGDNVLYYQMQEGACMLADSLIVTLTPAPSINLPNAQTLCLTDTPYDLAAATPAGGAWSGTGIVGNTFDPSIAGAGIHSITYTYYDAMSGCSNSATLEMEVLPLPEIMVNDTAYCNTAGLVALPTAQPPGGTWSGQGVVGSSFDPTLAGGVGNYTISYTFTDGFACTNTEQVAISIVSPETINAGNDFSICENSNPIDLSQIATPMGGTWNANGSQGLSGNAFDPAGAGVGIHTLTYTIGTGNCAVQDDIQIEVLSIPTVNAMNDFQICENEDPITLTASPAGGTWQANNGGFILGSVFDPGASGVGVYSFTYTYTDANACANSDEVIVTVLEVPTITTTDVMYCDVPGLVALPDAQPAGGTWTGAGVSNGSFDPQAAGGVGTYTLHYTYQDDNSCSNTAVATVTLIAPEIVDAGIPDTICIDGGILSLTAYSPADGLWSGTGIVDETEGLFDPMLAGAGLHLLTYSMGSGNCYVEDTKTVYVVDLEVNAGSDEDYCLFDDAILLSGYSPTGGQWSGTGIVDGQTGIFDPGLAGVGSHTLTYTYTDPMSGCVRVDSKEIQVIDIAQAAFEIPDLACRNEEITFVNLSPEGYEVFWDFGFGAGSSTDFSPSYSYTAVGTYTVTLIIQNEYGCADTTTQDITITDIPFAHFIPSVEETCAGDTVLFANQSFGDSLSYYWEFGDFMSSTQAEPGPVFFQQGFYDTTYVITLTVTNMCGSHTFQDLVVVHPQPDADFGLVPLTECSPLQVEFANASTGGASTYYWDFGNGNTSTEQFPEMQVYFTDSTVSIYEVTLITSNLCGVDTATAEIVVEPANVIASASASQIEGCMPLEVDFSNYSTPGATIDWDFGDGNTSSEENPSHVFTEAGEYTVIQYAGSDCGYDTTHLLIKVNPQPQVAFTHANMVCSEQEVFFENLSVNTTGHYWDFGDGYTSSENNPVHVYDSPGVYTVSLLAVSQFEQCEAIYQSTITILELPEASFSPSTTYGCAPLVVQFENTSSEAMFYHWDFGDGNSSISMSPQHTYEEAGTYAVTMRATDINGCFTDTTIYNVIVTEVPQAAFDFEKEAVCGLPATLHFDNLSQGALDYQWHFGEGSSSTTTDPDFTYTEAGSYEVVLISYNQFSCSDTTSITIDIYEHPVAGIAVETTGGCAPLHVRFTNASIASTDFHWFFGDGEQSLEHSPLHTYEEPGTYQIKLIASVNEECPDTTIWLDDIEVYPMAFANFEAEQIANDGTYELFNLSENADTYYWEFSDGATSTLENPKHRFYNNGIQQIYLEASNAYGCADDTLISITPEFIYGLFIPNAFSPEQGIGDVRLFKAKGIGLKEYRLQIFSTYGQLLWETTALDEQGRPTEGWDGRVDGELLPQDSYVWKCSGIFLDGSAWLGVEEDGRRKVMGSLVLLR